MRANEAEARPATPPGLREYVYKALQSDAEARFEASSDRESAPAEEEPSRRYGREFTNFYGSFESYQGMREEEGREGVGFNCIEFDRWEV